MLSPLKIGTVLLQAGTFIPDSVCVQTEPFCPVWQAITNVNGDDLDPVSYTHLTLPTTPYV